MNFENMRLERFIRIEARLQRKIQKLIKKGVLKFGRGEFCSILEKALNEEKIVSRLVSLIEKHSGKNQNQA